MKIRRLLPSLVLALAVSASATAIPPDLEARASALRKQASPAVLTWVREQGETLAKKTGPVDTAQVESHANAAWAAPGNVQGADIEALCFLVLMDAAKAAQEDIAAVMAGVKTINAGKAQQRDSLEKTQALARTHTPTPTPASNRVDLLVAAARKVEPRTQGADLSKLARR